ncbi:MAG: hypothetical protein V7K26_14475 [Nostoc sp.]|uniref:hypothetical protein n=1 Tax=Nostoc sp. TaxID=1180 RepID=UPI002FF34386
MNTISLTSKCFLKSLEILSLQLRFNPQSELWCDRFLAYISLGSQRLQRHARITPLHSLLLPLIVLPTFPQTSAV